MSPQSPTTDPGSGPRSDHPLPALLATLEGIGPRPALVQEPQEQQVDRPRQGNQSPPEGRLELSGHVLANWIIKATNHLAHEIDLQPGYLVVLDLPPHWKRFVLALAAWSLGAEVRIGPSGPDDTAGVDDTADAGVRVLATDETDAPGTEDADELLLLEARSLSMRFPGSLPPLAHDWVQEVRTASDRLEAPLGIWTGPADAVVLRAREADAAWTTATAGAQLLWV